MRCILDDFYTMSRMAEALDVERHTIARWIRNGDVNAQKVGTIWFIEKSEVERIKKERTKCARPV